MYVNKYIQDVLYIPMVEPKIECLIKRLLTFARNDF